MKKNVITYGTFDLFHYGHMELLRRAKELANGGKLIVAVSSDEFNAIKGKKSHYDYTKRKDFVESLRYVDLVIKENNWDQKVDDIKKYKIDIFTIGSDWRGKFDDLKQYCEVTYLDRTPNISSTSIKNMQKQNTGK